MAPDLAASCQRLTLSRLSASLDRNLGHLTLELQEQAGHTKNNRGEDPSVKLSHMIQQGWLWVHACVLIWLFSGPPLLTHVRICCCSAWRLLARKGGTPHSISYSRILKAGRHKGGQGYRHNEQLPHHRLAPCT
jgi:hypothetical protein